MVREALRAAHRLGADVVVSAGDFGVWPGASGKAFLDCVEGMAAARALDVIVVAGNHEDYDQIDAAPVDVDGTSVLRPRVRVVPRGHTARWGRFAWRFLGGARSIDGPGGAWPQNRGPLDEPELVPDQTGRPVMRPAGHDLGGWWPQEAITDEDVTAAIAAGPADVLVTHEAPLCVHLTDQHKPTDPLVWPAGYRQREMVSEVRAAVQPALTVSGHWHQHAVAHDAVGVAAVLADDTTPGQVQWVVVDDDARAPGPLLRIPDDWRPDLALTAVHAGSRRPNSRHRVTVTEDDLAELAWVDPASYEWPAQ